MQTGRNLRKTAIHDQLAKAGAYFTTGMGWEIPDWYAPKGVEAKVENYTWGRQNWFKYHEQEHKACREDVIFMDVTSMSNFLVQGRDAEKVLNNICANDVAVPVGKVVYTQWLNERGRLEADVTVTRLAEDKAHTQWASLLRCRFFSRNCYAIHLWRRGRGCPSVHEPHAQRISSRTRVA